MVYYQLCPEDLLKALEEFWARFQICPPIISKLGRIGEAIEWFPSGGKYFSISWSEEFEATVEVAYDQIVKEAKELHWKAQRDAKKKQEAENLTEEEREAQTRREAAAKAAESRSNPAADTVDPAVRECIDFLKRVRPDLYDVPYEKLVKNEDPKETTADAVGSDGNAAQKSSMNRGGPKSTSWQHDMFRKRQTDMGEKRRKDREEVLAKKRFGANNKHE